MDQVWVRQEMSARLIPVVFSGRGCLRMRNTMVKSNRKCPHFPACNWLTRVIFSRRGLLRVRNTMVKPKMSYLPVLLAKQEVPSFSRLWLIDSHRSHRKGLSQDDQQSWKFKMWKRRKSINYRQENTGLPVWGAKQEAATFLASPWCSMVFHFLFDEQNRKWKYFELHQRYQHP